MKPTSFRHGVALASIILFCTASLFAQEPRTPSKSKLDTALETASRTGRPVLIVGARDGCGLCQAFLAELQSDPNARAATSRFISLKYDVDDRTEWPKVANQYNYDGSYLPVILVLRADGKQLYGHAGAPPLASAFLIDQLKKSGPVPNAKQINQLREAADKAAELVQAGKIDQAVPLIKRHLDSSAFAEPVIELKKLAEELTATAKATLDESVKSMEADPPSFEAALAFVETSRLYGELPTIEEAIKDKEKEYRKNSNWVDLLNQAEMLSKAQAYVTDGKARQAIGIFQSLQQKYPGSPGAEKAKEQLAGLDTSDETAAASTPGADAPASESLKRASSYLRFGKSFQSKDPAKARKYYEKVIETAPNSELATEALQLLNQLP